MSLAKAAFRSHSPRFKSRVIQVGKVKLGGDEPIAIQSMTTSDTMNIEGTVHQVMQLADAGCDIVRITAPTLDDAQALEKIKNRLLKDNYTIPLVADIHFLPPAAMLAADFVEKIRINPGNFADRKMFKVKEYSNEEYASELLRIREKFEPLVLKLKTLGRALRIGTNHGSLSDRVMNRYGDTPEGMVESAFEYAEICRSLDFHNFCFSMKASNVGVMVEAYRLLVKRQLDRGWDYPIHLGVTEAGEGEDARIKSSVGIGTLLAEGIGDTVRVSLTEAAVKEIPVARAIAGRLAKSDAPYLTHVHVPSSLSLEEARVETPLVWLRLSDSVDVNDLLKRKEMADVLFVESPTESIRRKWDILKAQWGSSCPKLAVAFRSGLDPAWVEMADYLVGSRIPKEWASKQMELLEIQEEFSSQTVKNPTRTVMMAKPYRRQLSELDRLVDLSAKAGRAFVDHPFAGIFLDGEISAEESVRLAYGILQATRRRMTKTEYIACPSCGRTLFDLEETTARIKSVTSHLKGLKIAIMGCIVNGPGEMADADFGYVGGAPGRVNLYVQKECVERNIPSAEAPQRLVDLIKKHNRWVEPEDLEKQASA